MDIRDTEEYKSGYFSVVKCPCCGKDTLDSYWICENCGWAFDEGSRDADDSYYSSCNNSTLGEYKKNIFSY